MQPPHGTTSPLRSIGIVAWDDIELTVVSALLAGLPILFTGAHAAAKTEGSYALAHAILGDKLRWAKYECPLVQVDDLVGFPDPSSLATGTIRFVGTAISVWNINACALDELTRAPQSTIQKLMELVRTKKVFGLDTPIEFVFSTANPPSREYQSSKIDVAMGSRFVIVSVPAYWDMTDADAESILTGTLRGTWDWWAEAKARTPVYEPTIVLRIREVMRRSGFRMSARQALYLRDMLAWSKVAESVGCRRTTDDLVRLVLSCVPEVSEVCGAADATTLTTALRSFFESRGKDLPNMDDWPLYLAAFRSRIGSCSSPEDAEVLIEQLPLLVTKLKTNAGDIQALLQDALPVILQHLPPRFAAVLVGADTSLPALVKKLFT